MLISAKSKQDFTDCGFIVIDNVISEEEIENIIRIIEAADTSKPTFRKTTNLFAIRQFLKDVPKVLPIVLSKRLQLIIKELFGDGYNIVKSIYFDKPEESNWFVSYHQDLTISVDRKIDIEGFGPWSIKQNQYAVQRQLTC